MCSLVVSVYIMSHIITCRRFRGSMAHSLCIYFVCTAANHLSCISSKMLKLTPCWLRSRLKISFAIYVRSLLISFLGATISTLAFARLFEVLSIGEVWPGRSIFGWYELCSCFFQFASIFLVCIAFPGSVGHSWACIALCREEIEPVAVIIRSPHYHSIIRKEHLMRLCQRWSGTTRNALIRINCHFDKLMACIEHIFASKVERLAKIAIVYSFAYMLPFFTLCCCCYRHNIWLLDCRSSRYWWVWGSQNGTRQWLDWRTNWSFWDTNW